MDEPVDSDESAPGHQSQAERVRETMAGQILRAELRPGEIVIESELAREYGVSKTPVREALQTLAIEGLVTVLPRKGYLIRSLSFSDIRDVMDLRLIIEPRLLRSTALNSTPALVEELRTILREQFRDDASLDEQLVAANAFHLACIRASRNARAVSIVAMLSYEVQRLHYLLPVVGGHVTSPPERHAHSAIVDAIAAGDAAEAETRMREHLTETSAAMVKAFYEAGSIPDLP
ncbi:MAG: hypothetical protein JWP66_317 [Naasia sp.]|jgi:DNA-binding GntR family transcriptional regulator|nr:hypothetical protein [Naasia sp.]